jgi:hypothetical protein
MDDRLENGKLVAGVKEGKYEFVENHKATLDAAIEDSSHMAILVNLLKELQDYYLDKTARLNRKMSNGNRVN